MHIKEELEVVTEKEEQKSKKKQGVSRVEKSRQNQRGVLVEDESEEQKSKKQRSSRVAKSRQNQRDV